jgi:hypothetical protein
MGDLQVHANEVRNCKACYGRIVWLESANRRRSAFNVPNSERGKSWLTIGDRDFHVCQHPERLAFLKEQRLIREAKGKR